MNDITALAQRMKAAAEKAGKEHWQTRKGFSGVEVIVKGSMTKGLGCMSFQPVAADFADGKTAKTVALFNPANVLALVEALEAKEPHHNGMMQLSNELVMAKRRITELEAEVSAWTNCKHDGATYYDMSGRERCGRCGADI